MSIIKSSGKKFRDLLEKEKPLQLIGSINALAAMMAERVGIKALYLSGAGVANASYGLPDLGITTLDNVAEDARRITHAVDLPLIVDIDTGYGGVALTITRTIKTLEKIGVAGIHIEDQMVFKRCGHRPNKVIVPPEEMIDRLKAALDARKDPDFYIIARTDAFAMEGIEGVIKRAKMYESIGVDAIFPDAFTSIDQYKILSENISIPIIANITEFGYTPLFTLEELKSVNVGIVLYPLSAFRAMYKAAEEVYKTIIQSGTQKSLINKMQTRDELYNLLNYEYYEKYFDRLYGSRDESV
ncbi:MAG: methylisocitrate lyase [Promethearchaeota archaeon]|jgi:methylisocitrate lyase